MRDPVLVIMAAGMGSRFGGLKQITAIDDENQKIIDYSLYDARKAGFTKVVFIIKHEIEEIFKEEIGKRMEDYFDVRYVFQEVDKLPEGYSVPEGRVKPWGTAHAIACAADAIDGPFAVINADDYYGPTAMTTIYNFLKEDRDAGEHAMVGYMLRNTVTENGSVSRGVCVAEDGFLTDITERTKIIKKGTDAAYTEDGEQWIDLSGDTIVSMNMWGFQREILDQFVARFKDFLDNEVAGNPLKSEYFLPTVANAQIKEGLGSVRVLTTKDVWHGVTYPEDLEPLKEATRDMKAEGLYPNRLWMIPAAAYHFEIPGAPVSMERYGCGHINQTYLVVSTTGKRYILQRITDAFDTKKLMSNISSVVQYLKKKHGPESTMDLIYTTDGLPFYSDTTGHYRMYAFVENSLTLQNAETRDDFYESAVAFGQFQNMLAKFPAEQLFEAIPNFHNTVDRYRIFRETVEKDVCGRVKDVQPEIEFALAHEELGATIVNLLKDGELPLRVTHNDTKLNNVLLSIETRKPLCVIDLDTVMPGSSVYDFGDSIRFGAATAAEDEKDLSKMMFDLDLFTAFTEGYLSACKNLTDKEIEMLPMGAIIMTLECGVRFLTDHIDGDHYFAIHREGHNLDRARTQFKLVSEMEKHLDEMKAIVAAISGKED